MAVRIQGASNLAEVNSSGELKTTLTTTPASAGIVTFASENDSGAVFARQVQSTEVQNDYRLRVGLDALMYSLSFEGTNVAQAHVLQSAATWAIAQNNGYLTINSGGSVASGNANIRTYRTFPLFGSLQTYAEFRIKEGDIDASLSTSEWGFGYVSGVATPTDGVFFRRISSTEMRAVINTGGAELASTALTMPAGYVASEMHHYVVSVSTNWCEWWIDNTLVYRVATPSNSGFPTAASAQPMFVRAYSTGASNGARRIDVAAMFASLGAGDIDKPWGQVVCGMGGGSYQIQPGTASGQTATYANGAAAGAGTWTASTAPATNSLGGLWTSPASGSMPAGGESDYPIFAYLNPAGTNALPGKTLYVTGIRICETIATSAIGATVANLCWGVAAGSTASSLATTDAATTVGPRRLPIGSQFFAASAAIGTQTAAIDVDFSSAPLVVPAGLYFHVFMRLLNATAATGAMRGAVQVRGYFE